MAITVGNQLDIGQAYYYLSSVYQKIEEQKKANSCLKVSLEIGPIISYQSLIAFNYASLSNNYLPSRKFEIAIDYYKKTEELAQGNRTQIAAFHDALGSCYLGKLTKLCFITKRV